MSGAGQPAAPPAAPETTDHRQARHGTLLHQDGAGECVAGGRDDCWGPDKYRHDRTKDCRKQTVGCARCEVNS